LTRVRELVPEIEMNMLILVGIRVVLTPALAALARMLTMRITRAPLVPGGSNGTPAQTMEFSPALAPWNMLGRAVSFVDGMMPDKPAALPPP